MPTSSIQFDETMSGYFALGCNEPATGASVGCSQDTRLSMHATVNIADINAFIADTNHTAQLSGTIDFPPLGLSLPAPSGVFNLFKPTDDPGLTLMIYELQFSHGGEDYYLAGRKLVKDDAGFDLWSDTTTLHTCLHRGSDSSGEIIGAGILTLGVIQLLALLRSMRTPNSTTLLNKLSTISRFAVFFTRALWSSYVVAKFCDYPMDRSMDATLNYDVIVIGSGFGGAITAARLAQKGYRVCVLERGRRWTPDSFPRRPDAAWWWSHDRPDKFNGWLDLRTYPNMAVAQGCGVGGGSLIYANVFVEPPANVFDQGWPPEITFAGLKPYFERATKMLNVQEVPDNQWPPKMRLLYDAAKQAGYERRFRKMPLAVNFDPAYSYALPDPHADSQSKDSENAYGIKQGTCVHCGNCDIGCQVNARNTLDLNYLPLAEQHNAVVKPLHLVTRIMPLTTANGNLYRVDFQRIDPQTQSMTPGHLNATRIIVAAGTMGTNELLLRCRDHYRTLPRISPQLGRGWSSNGDFLTPSLQPKDEVEPTVGPTITAAVDFLDGALEGRRFWVQDGGFPDVVKGGLSKLRRGNPWSPFFSVLQDLVAQGHPLSCVMPWFGQAVDAADGRLSLRRGWLPPFRRKLYLSWSATGSRLQIQALVDMHKHLAAVSGGIAHVPVLWEVFQKLATPHPLGGCRIGNDSANAVVDHKGEVFGYPGLYVADGAILPAAVGMNPSCTIAALAERIADLIPAQT